MNSESALSILIVGWGHSTFERLWNRIDEKSSNEFSHVVHPKYTTDNWPGGERRGKIYFFREHDGQVLPAADHELLASLEEFLLTQRSKNKMAALILDDAQALTTSHFEQLRLVSNLEVANGKLLQIVLLGQRDLMSRLQKPYL